MHILYMRYGYAMDILRISYGYAMDILWIHTDTYAYATHTILCIHLSDFHIKIVTFYASAMYIFIQFRYKFYHKWLIGYLL